MLALTLMEPFLTANTCIHTYVDTYIHTRAGTHLDGAPLHSKHLHTYIRGYIHTYIHVLELTLMEPLFTAGTLEAAANLSGFASASIFRAK